MRGKEPEDAPEGAVAIPLTGELEDHQHHNRGCWSLCVELIELLRQGRDGDALTLCRKNNVSVARVIEVPLEHILHEGHFRERMIDWEGVAITSPAFKWDGELVWGATARISQNLVDVLRSAPRRSG